MTNARASAPVEWAQHARPVAYPVAIAAMEARVNAIRDGRARELVWLLEHPPLYTAGTGARATDLLQPDRFPVYRTGRGGQYTYHGPGQRIAYVMLDLSHRRQDVRWYVRSLEDWLIAALAQLGVTADRREGQPGVWTAHETGDAAGSAKIAALGVRLRRWVTLHGVSVNVAPDLDHFSGIVPCGVSDAGVTSLAAIGARAGMAEVDAVLRATFEQEFGSPTVDASVPFASSPGLP